MDNRNSDVDDNHPAQDNDPDHTHDSEHTVSDNSEPADGNREDRTTVITHSVIFKCIGASRDMNSQVTLNLASKEISSVKEVEVQLKPEE